MTKQCQECGKPVNRAKTNARFCGTPCRLAFTRRRRDRGAELYDFVMSGSSEPVVHKLTEAYRLADKVLRDGRPSYQPAEVAVLNLPLSFGNQGDKR